MILRYTTDGHGPTMTQQLMQQQLRLVDPTSPAASLEVPTVRYIQGVQGNSKRIWSLIFRRSDGHDSELQMHCLPARRSRCCR